MSKELDNAFIDVRNAFRLLSRYQSRVLDIVSYIREHSAYTDMWGRCVFSDTIRTKQNSPDPEYAKLSVDKNMWSWDFMYNYVFEYYFGQTKIQRKDIDMSVIQVSDDGFYKSTSQNPSETNISSFATSEESNSLLVFTVGHKCWLRDKETENYDDFLAKFLASEQNECVFMDEKGGFAITKKYKMQSFSSQLEADKVIADFGKLVKDNTELDIFKGKN
jgi:hypothetical protein